MKCASIVYLRFTLRCTPLFILTKFKVTTTCEFHEKSGLNWIPPVPRPGGSGCGLKSFLCNFWNTSWKPHRHFLEYQIKVMVLGAVKTTINDHGCQHVTGRIESIRMFLSKQTGWPTFSQSHRSVKTVEWFKKRLSHYLPTLRKGENKWPAQILQNCPTG